MEFAESPALKCLEFWETNLLSDESKYTFSSDGCNYVW